MATTLDPKNDTLIVNDSSQGDFGQAALGQVVSSALSAGTGVGVSLDTSTGKVVISSAPMPNITLTAGVGLTGGGALTADVTVNLDISGLPNFSVHDQTADQVAVFDASTGAMVKAPISSLHAGLYLPLTGGTVTGNVTVNGTTTSGNFTTAGLVGLGSFTAATIPPAAGNVGAIAYASDRKQLVYSDGVNWRRLNKTKIYV